MGMSRLAIVAALEREVAPLVREWQIREIAHDGRRYRLFESDGVFLICSGIGVEAARRATEAVIKEVQPGRVISVGFAGALDATMKVADVLEPRVVVNAADGARVETGSGRGTLVSYSAVADRDQKARLAKSYGAVAVDMEAASVAQGAQARGVEFGALKVISDAAEFTLPPVERFVSSDGHFRSARFAVHVAMRPWLWGRTMVLARNGARASRALCATIEAYLKREALAATVDREVARSV